MVVPGTCSGARETAQWTKALARKLGVLNSVPGTYDAEKRNNVRNLGFDLHMYTMAQASVHAHTHKHTHKYECTHIHTISISNKYINKI